MSESERMSRSAASLPMNLVRGMLSHQSVQQIAICGSYRRGRADVGDVDMLVLPLDAEAFLDHTDSLVQRDLLSRGTKKGGSEAWGTKKRLMQFKGISFDVELADKYNWGYKLWLRTGPGEANTLLMGLLSKHKSRIRMDEGYLWHVTYHTNYVSASERKAAKNNEPAYHKLARLRVPDEETFFRLLGMPFIPPADRNEIVYRCYLGTGVRTPAPEELKAFYLSEAEEELLANSGIKQKPLL